MFILSAFALFAHNINVQYNTHTYCTTLLRSFPVKVLGAFEEKAFISIVYMYVCMYECV